MPSDDPYAHKMPDPYKIIEKRDAELRIAKYSARLGSAVISELKSELRKHGYSDLLLDLIIRTAEETERSKIRAEG